MRKHFALTLVLVALVAAWFLWQRGCDRVKPDIEVDGGAVMVRNQTPDDWMSVRIWINDYYSGAFSEITAGSFVREPVTRFVAAQGQTLKASATITSVVVLATTRAGKPVRVVLGTSAWH